MTKRFFVWAKGLIFLALGPWLLLRLSARLDFLLPRFSPSWLASAAGLALEVLGAYVAVRAYLILSFVGKDWPFLPTRLLVDRYIYRFVRHPLYWGYIVFWLGFGLRRGQTGFIAGTALFGAVLFLHVLLVEDPALRKRFGARFETYRRQVPLISPTWKELAFEWVEFNWFLLITMTAARKLFPFIWNVRAEGVEHVPLDGGCMVVGNHSNLVDPFLVGMYSTRPIRFMATDETFRKPIPRILFRLWGAFPKRRWDRDISALRNVRRWLAEGRFVGIFPEGQRNWDGAGVGVGDEVYRFLHHCHAPILCTSLAGAHAGYPRWSKWPAFTTITIRYFPLLDPDQFATAGDLRRAIEERIFSGMQETPPRRTLLRTPRGITTVAWGCIQCGGVRTLRETGNSVVCESCGAAWDVDDRLNFVARHSGEVLRESEYHAQLRLRLAQGKMQGGLVTSCTVAAFRRSGPDLAKLGIGRLLVDRDGVSFEGDGIAIRKPLSEIRSAYLSLANQLVVSDTLETLQFEIIDDSPLRLEEYLGTAAGNLAPQWNPVRTGPGLRQAGE